MKQRSTWLFPDCQVLTVEVQLPNLRSYFCFYSCNYTGSQPLSHVVLHPTNRMSFSHLLVERGTDQHDVTNPTEWKSTCSTHSKTDQHCRGKEVRENYLTKRQDLCFSSSILLSTECFVFYCYEHDQLVNHYQRHSFTLLNGQ